MEEYRLKISELLQNVHSEKFLATVYYLVYYHVHGSKDKEKGSD